MPSARRERAPPRATSRIHPGHGGEPVERQAPLDHGEGGGQLRDRGDGAGLVRAAGEQLLALLEVDDQRALGLHVGEVSAQPGDGRPGPQAAARAAARRSRGRPTGRSGTARTAAGGSGPPARAGHAATRSPSVSDARSGDETLAPCQVNNGGTGGKFSRPRAGPARRVSPGQRQQVQVQQVRGARPAHQAAQRLQGPGAVAGQRAPLRDRGRPPGPAARSVRRPPRRRPGCFRRGRRCRPPGRPPRPGRRSPGPPAGRGGWRGHPGRRPRTTMVGSPFPIRMRGRPPAAASCAGPPAVVEGQRVHVRLGVQREHPGS